jgi:hypothetical protein
MKSISNTPPAESLLRGSRVMEEKELLEIEAREE